MTPQPSKVMLGAWLAILILCSLFAGLRLMAGVTVETDIRALLSTQSDDPFLQKWLSEIQQTQLQRSALLIGHPQKEIALSAGKAASQSFEATGSLGVIPTDFHDPTQTLKPLRFHLVSDEDRHRLKQITPSQWANEALQRLISLGNFSSRTSFADDPLGFWGRYLDALPTYTDFSPAGECLHKVEQGLHWCLLALESQSDGFSLAEAERSVHALDAAIAAADRVAPGIRTLDSGIARHSHLAASTAKKEISWISMGSGFGITLLILMLLKRPGPLGLGAIVLATGAATGLAACVAIYDQLLLIALVFGACLLGVAVDYLLHFLCANGDSPTRLRQISSGLNLGFLSTCLAFSGLFLTPYDSLRQIGLFGIAGLLGAWLTVRGLLPWIPIRVLGEVSARKRDRLVQVLHSQDERNHLEKPALVIAAFGIIGAAIVGVSTLTTEDNLKAMHFSSTQLIQAETEARQVLAGLDAAQLLIVEAKSAESLWLAGEWLEEKLAEIKAAGSLNQYRSYSQALPSESRQLSNHSALQPLYLPGGSIDQLARRLGLPTTWAEAERKIYLDAKPIKIGRWLEETNAVQAPNSALVREHDGRWIGLIQLGGVRDVTALKQLAKMTPRIGTEHVASIHWHDPIEAASSTLKTTRLGATKILLFSAIAVFLLLCIQFNPAGAMILLTPIFLSLCICLAWLSWSGTPFTLFRLFALLLVVGLAIDYSVFLRESASHSAACLVAIVSSAATTLLGFGLLSFSSTPALHEFGSTVVLGVGSALATTLLLYRTRLLKPSA